MQTSSRWLVLGLSLLSTVLHAATPSRSFDIRRTTDGIPHIRADNWRALGQGIGYAQAQDALCTLADAFVTYAGQRSWFFGATARPALDSTFGQPQNLELDFFFRAFADATMVARFRANQPRDVQVLIEGFASGYNRYLDTVRRDSGERPACYDAPWVRPISAADIYRRLYALQIAGGYARFIPEIVAAEPGKPAVAGRAPTAVNKLAHRIGQQPDLGSNMLAFGSQVTRGSSVLLGNPHWFWGGPDRFYQMHLILPGRLNVAGVGMLGVPLVMIGFNEQVAWSHTVSDARRFGLFDLTLDPAKPTHYRVDGTTEAMTSRVVTVKTRDASGKVERQRRRLYRTRFGPLVNLAGPGFGLDPGTTHALAMRDVNDANFRVFRNFFYWNQARSLDDFIAIQRRESAVPWVNTAAIGRGDGRVWYADIGAVPNVPDELRTTCATTLTPRLAEIDALIPLLDGSRSACDWRIDPTAVQPGAMPAHAMPSLLREDYVANMNDSYWLTNSQAPLEGYPAVLGGERHELSLRTRLGHALALARVATPTSAEALSQHLMHDALDARVYSAELFKEALLDGACTQAAVEIEQRRIDISTACEVLRRWPNRGNADSRGALLWEAFWEELEAIPASERYEVPFSSAAPLATPRAPRGSDVRVAQALATAVATLQDRGSALDAPLGTKRYARVGNERVPLFGGCGHVGYFAIACNANQSEDIGAEMDVVMGPGSVANTYLQVVRFTSLGVEAHTLLAHGERETAFERPGADTAVVRYAKKRWLRFPFTEAAIERDLREADTQPR